MKMELFKGTFLSSFSIYVLNFTEIILNPIITALLTFVISVLTIVWLVYKVCDSRITIKLKRKELNNE